MRDPDILETIYRAAVIDGVSLNELRNQFGGRKVYLRATHSPDLAQARAERERRAAIIADAHRMPVRQVAARHGVSKSTAARLRKLG